MAEIIIDLGKVAPTWGGAWNATTDYEKLTIVTDEGQSYLSLRKSIGVKPGTNSAFWQLVAAKGAKGEKGDDGEGGSGGGGGEGGVIGVAYDTDGVLYWTLNGSWLVGPDGNKVQAQGRDGSSSGSGAFKSIVFARTNGTPGAPGAADGSYNQPVPQNSYVDAAGNTFRWSDGIPAGEAKLWMTTRVFTTDGNAPQQAQWTTPAQATDTADLDLEFSEIEGNPGTPSTMASNWHNSATERDIWMAVRKKSNGVWGNWEVSKIKGEAGPQGSPGPAGPYVFKSHVFRRTNQDISNVRPVGGSYDYPYPDGNLWTDGVPAGDGLVWMSTRIFASNENELAQTQWSLPALITDTEYMDYEFSTEENAVTRGLPQKSSPAGTEGNAHWSNDPTGAVWMAMRPVNNAAYETGSVWTIVRIKGEKGERGSDGTSLQFKGHVSATTDLDGSYAGSVGDCFLVGTDLKVYVWTGVAWSYAGTLQAESQFIHVAYSNDGGTTFSDSGTGETPGKYIAILVTSSNTRPSSPSDYSNWYRWQGLDGFGYEFIYKRTTDDTAPNIPATSTDTDGYVPDGWSADPPGVNSTYPYCWMVWRQKSNNTWGAWNGVSSTGKAILFSHYGQDGMNGLSPNTAFKSIVFKRSNSSVGAPSGGSYASPVPSGWSDGIPSGAEKLWMSTRIFSSDGLSPEQNAWTTPQVVADNEYMDYEFSSLDSPSAPTKSSPSGASSTGWSDTPSSTTIWMAMRPVSNGAYAAGSSWSVIKIKGEDGTDGIGLDIKGTVATIASLPGSGNTMGDAYIVTADNYLYVWDGDSWEPVRAGEQGPQGPAGTPSYLHVRYSAYADGTSFSTTPNTYIGIAATNSSTAPSDKTAYTWSYWRGQDGFGYEYIYIKSQYQYAPYLPTVPSGYESDAEYQADDYVPSGWSDDPLTADQSYPTVWWCYRQKVAGVWGPWVGDANNPGNAALFCYYGVDVSSVQNVLIQTKAVSTNAVPTLGYSGLPGSPSSEWASLMTDDYLFARANIQFGVSEHNTKGVLIAALKRDPVSIKVEFGRSTSNSSAPTSWRDEPYSLTSSYPYMWVRYTATFSDGSTKVSAIYAGIQRTDGLGTDFTYKLQTQATSGGPDTTGSWTDGILSNISDSTPNLYARLLITPEDSQSSSAYDTATLVGYLSGYTCTHLSFGLGVSSYISDGQPYHGIVNFGAGGYLNMHEPVLWLTVYSSYSDGSSTTRYIYLWHLHQDDTTFLAKIFNEAEIDNKAGALLRNLIGVTQVGNDNSVVAMLNASDIGFDYEHGKLLIAAGIPALTEANEAKFKVYEDGYIEATSGKIASFSIAADGDDSNYYELRSDWEQDDAQFVGNGYVQVGAKKIKIHVGSSYEDKTVIAGFGALNGAALSAYSGGSSPAFTASAPNGASAIFIAAGDIDMRQGEAIIGFKTPAAKASGSTTIDSSDHTIYNDAASRTFTINCSNSKNGDEFEIFSTYAFSIQFVIPSGITLWYFINKSIVSANNASGPGTHTAGGTNAFDSGHWLFKLVKSGSSNNVHNWICTKLNG